jgi:hypothetical protein
MSNRELDKLIASDAEYVSKAKKARTETNAKIADAQAGDLNIGYNVIDAKREERAMSADKLSSILLKVFAISVVLITFLFTSDSVEDIAVESTVNNFAENMGRSDVTVRLVGYTSKDLGKYKEVTIQMIYMHDKTEVKGDPVVIYVTGNRFSGGNWSSNLANLVF